MNWFICARRFRIAAVTFCTFLAVAILADAAVAAGWKRIASGRIVVVYDGKTRTWEIADRRGRVLVGSLTSSVEIDGISFATHHGGRNREVTSGTFRDRFGGGQEIVLRSPLLNGLLEIEQHLKIHRGSPRILIETEIRNLGKKPLNLTKVIPLHTTESSRGLFPIGPTDGWSILLESFDLAETPRLDFVDGACQITGYWSGALWNRHAQIGLVLGFRAPEAGIGEIEIARPPDKNGFSLKTAVRLGNFRIAPGQSLTTNTIVLRPTESLIGAIRNEARFLFPPRHSWITPEEERRPPAIWVAHQIDKRPIDSHRLNQELEGLSKLSDFGMDGVLFDDTFSATLSNRGIFPPDHWLGPSNRDQRRRLKELVTAVREWGFRPAIQLSPFLVHDLAPTIDPKRLSEAIVSDAHRNPIPLSLRDAWSHFPRPPSVRAPFDEVYCLDTTAATARHGLQETFEKLRHEMGFVDFHLDGLALAAMIGPRQHQEVTPTESVARGLTWIREEIGQQSHLVAAGTLLGTVGDTLDGINLGPDSTADWRWFPELLRIAARRFALNGISFYGSLASLYVGGDLTLWEARSFATLHAMFGGSIRLLDRPSSLDRERLEILKKILPPSGKAATPIGVMEKDLPTCFHLSTRKPAPRELVAFFNPTDHATIEHIDFESLGLEPQSTFAAFESWSDSFLGLVKDGLSVPLSPHGCAVVNLVAVDGDTPLLLSSSRHLVQELTAVRSSFFDAASTTFFVTLNGITGETTHLRFYVPEGAWKNPELERISPDQSHLAQRDNGLLEARITAVETGPISFRLRLESAKGIDRPEANSYSRSTEPRNEDGLFVRRHELGKAPVAIRADILHIGLPDDPLLHSLIDSHAPVESIDPRLGSVARALIGSFLANQTRPELPLESEIGTPVPNRNPRVLILGTDCLSTRGFSLLNDVKIIESTLSFLRHGGILIWMPQRVFQPSTSCFTAARGIPVWLAEATGINFAPALPGLLKGSFDGSSRPNSGPNQQAAESSQTERTTLDTILGLIPGEEEGSLLACPQLPIKALGIGSVERMGQPMARIVLTPVGTRGGLFVAAADHLENLVSRLTACVRTPADRAEFLGAIDSSRSRSIELEWRSSILKSIDLDPLHPGILNIGDPESEARFSFKVSKVREHLLDRIPQNGVPLSDTGTAYSGSATFEVSLKELGGRDLVVATMINTYRLETGVSVSVNGKWLFDHRYSNFAGSRVPGWDVEFLHFRADELGARNVATIQIAALGSSTSSSYRYGFFKSPSKNAIYLSDLDPESVRPPGSGVALDRNANGGLLQIGDRLYYKGVGIAADTTATYAIHNSYRRFRAVLAVDAVASALGEVRFRVRLDGKTVFESDPVDRTSSPVEVDIPLASATTLEIEVEDAGGRLPGELADWCNARFVLNR